MFTIKLYIRVGTIHDMMTLKRIYMDFYGQMCKISEVIMSDYVGVLKTTSRYDDLLGKLRELSMLSYSVVMIYYCQRI